MSPGARQLGRRRNPAGRVRGGFSKKPPPSGSLGGYSFPSLATFVCRQVWGGGLTRETKRFLKLLSYLAFRFQKQSQFEGSLWFSSM